ATNSRIESSRPYPRTCRPSIHRKSQCLGYKIGTPVEAHGGASYVDRNRKLNRSISCALSTEALSISGAKKSTCGRIQSRTASKVAVSNCKIRRGVEALRDTDSCHRSGSSIQNI